MLGSYNIRSFSSFLWCECRITMAIVCEWIRVLIPFRLGRPARCSQAFYICSHKYWKWAIITDSWLVTNLVLYSNIVFNCLNTHNANYYRYETIATIPTQIISKRIYLKQIPSVLYSIVCWLNTNYSNKYLFCVNKKWSYYNYRLKY